MYAIQTKGLSKQYPDVLAVDGIDLNVQKGEIYGFLGLNGAGKTTSIRAILGMITPSSGSVEVLGQGVGPYGKGPWDRVGHMVEAPTAYSHLTVRENLLLALRYHPGISPKRIDAVVDLLKLMPYVNRKAGVLSTGNLQRLGLARALLHEPELLLLDEPTNGLDPAGVVEIRHLLRQLVDENGITVFMSSHILTEVSRLADRIGIIHHGKMIEEYDAEKIEQLRSLRLVVRTDSNDSAVEILNEAGFAAENEEDVVLIKDIAAIEQPEKIATLLVNAGYPPSYLSVEQEDLESHFLRLTGDLT